MEEIARDLAVIPLSIVNAYLVGDSRSWVLVDSGMPGNAGKIKAAAEKRFGPEARPRAILLTHGHFDHAGSSKELADLWDVPVYAHPLERPYLTGASQYPPLDTSAPGFFSLMARAFRSKTVYVGARLADLGSNLPELGMSDWELVRTPGHTPGHVSFFRRSDSTLLAGDALTTVNIDNPIDLITKRQQVCRPPTPGTPDWEQARQSVQAINALHPRLIAAGHGTPMSVVSDQLNELANHFPVPKYGRYVRQPARADETGVTYLPPEPPDRLVRATTGVAAALILGGVGAFLLRRTNQSND